MQTATQYFSYIAQFEISNSHKVSPNFIDVSDYLHWLDHSEIYKMKDLQDDKDIPHKYTNYYNYTFQKKFLIKLHIIKKK